MTAVEYAYRMSKQSRRTLLDREMTALDDAYRRFSRDPFPLPTNEQLADLE